MKNFCNSFITLAPRWQKMATDLWGRGVVFKNVSNCGDLWLVIRSKCCLETNREKMQIMGTMSLATFLIISLINHTFCSICVSICFSLTVCFIADALYLSLQCSASHTHSLGLSAVLLSSLHFLFDIKTTMIFSTSSLIATDCHKMHHCFT
jgi:hypothetical protein